MIKKISLTSKIILVHSINFVLFVILFNLYLWVTYNLMINNCTLLRWKIENNSLGINFIHSLEKTHLLALELIFISSSCRVYMYIKFVISNERLGWYKKLSLLTYRPTQNKSDTFAITLLMGNSEHNSRVNLNSFTKKKRSFSSWFILN